ncbi:hypothetical protein [Streptomyces lavendulocolor]|uniref:hypothetical protein n=1 Tax=Streptomyces lavendulocolor TaxID=67316 RepID=UPI003C2DADC7
MVATFGLPATELSAKVLSAVWRSLTRVVKSQRIDERGLDVGVDLLQPGEEELRPACGDLFAAYVVGGYRGVPGGLRRFHLLLGCLNGLLLGADVVG